MQETARARPARWRAWTCLLASALAALTPAAHGAPIVDAGAFPPEAAEVVGYKAKEEREHTQTTLNRSGIEAGGDIHIEAREGELTLEATRVRTEGELTLATPGQLNLAATMQINGVTNQWGQSH